MANRTSYEPVLSGNASAFLVFLPKRKQKLIINLLFRLAGNPFQLGDYSTRNEDGREIQHLNVGGWIISFWSDHAMREIRITEIDEV